MTEDKLEGMGLPANGLVNLDVSLVLAFPLYLYVEPWVETWSKSLLKVGFARKARVPLGLQDQTPQSLASGPDAMGLGVWPRARRQGLRRLAPWPPQNSFCTDLKPHGLDPLA